MNIIKPDQSLVEALAAEYAIDPSFVEKDWYVTQALAVLKTVKHECLQSVFSGGTSLFKAYGLIQRFSEDIDFQVIQVKGVTNRSQRREYRSAIVSRLCQAGFELIGEPEAGDEGRFFKLQLQYPAEHCTVLGLRPHIQVEMSFKADVAVPAEMRSLSSLLAKAQDFPAEVDEFYCVHPLETAADKLSALAWRTCARELAADRYDPTTIRHLHDFAALSQEILTRFDDFLQILQIKMSADLTRTKILQDSPQRLQTMLILLSENATWRSEYQDYVARVSLLASDQQIQFDQAYQTLVLMVERVLKNWQSPTTS